MDDSSKTSETITNGGEHQSVYPQLFKTDDSATLSQVEKSMLDWAPYSWKFGGGSLF